jgi:hypothetical protein
VENLPSGGAQFTLRFQLAGDMPAEKRQPG